MRIVVDAMGSDHAPVPDVEGAVRGARRYGAEIILVGQPERIEPELARYDTSGLTIEIQPASQVIEMGEHPSQAVRAKPDSSMVVGMGLLRSHTADAFVSAGNSGGVLAAALASAGRVGRIEGVQRPAISTVFPTSEGFSFLLDIGANADCRPEWLVQFALMGRVYAQRVLKVANPRVGLLSNGEEDTKGSRLVQEAHALLKGMDINFVGNVEGKDLTRGVVDVVVADGFAGNVAIKTAEGVSSMLLSLLRQEIKSRPLATLGGLLAKPAFRAMGKRLDYREYGGGPLLGVDGAVIIGHGRSDGLAMENAVRVAFETVNSDLVAAIREQLQATRDVWQTKGAEATVS
jgi:glycerol-3-phosphate acyltransferase PlsX